MSDQILRTKVINVGTLLQYNKLTIPLYQRPYKWTTKNVNQLIDDIFLHKKKSAYRLGTIVLHDDGVSHNIVDGQQRTITLILIAKALFEEKTNDFKNPELILLLEILNQKIINPEFSSDISIKNIQDNYREIVRRVAGFDEETISFLFNKCEFIQFILSDISEAFQFFDSQNARGKDLEPHDLLKAYHLREFAQSDDGVKNQVVDSWESMQTKELANLFGEYLFRIRSWSKGNSARYFTKDNVDLFKGINIENIDNYPYTELIRIAHFFVDGYKSSYERKIDRNQSNYPFQIDQTIINGRRFFEMISHYKEIFKTTINRESSSVFLKYELNKNAETILKTINSYEGKNRTGDGYVRTLFDCALLYYIDRFGIREISKAIERIFIWAYSLRLNYQAVQIASMDNHVLDGINMFRQIKEANNPNEIITLHLKPVEKNKSTKTEDIADIFENLRYYDKPAK
jgi:uncharacterized protein with ParB-like and HNH nuclease domain